MDTLGENHASTARTINNIGMTSYRKGDYKNALRYFERSLKIKNNTVG
jgi:Tfp pilus assembly protein PilF